MNNFLIILVYWFTIGFLAEKLPYAQFSRTNVGKFYKKQRLGRVVSFPSKLYHRKIGIVLSVSLFGIKCHATGLFIVVNRFRPLQSNCNRSPAVPTTVVQYMS